MTSLTGGKTATLTGSPSPRATVTQPICFIFLRIAPLGLNPKAYKLIIITAGKPTETRLITLLLAAVSTTAFSAAFCETPTSLTRSSS